MEVTFTHNKRSSVTFKSGELHQLPYVRGRLVSLALLCAYIKSLQGNLKQFSCVFISQTCRLGCEPLRSLAAVFSGSYEQRLRSEGCRRRADSGRRDKPLVMVAYLIRCPLYMFYVLTKLIESFIKKKCIIHFSFCVFTLYTGSSVDCNVASD